MCCQGDTFNVVQQVGVHGVSELDSRVVAASANQAAGADSDTQIGFLTNGTIGICRMREWPFGWMFRALIHSAEMN